VYSTFLGGRGSDYGNSIALDASGDAFVAGSTGSSDFPVTSGVFQTAYHGMSTAFITELNPTGTDEVYSSYLGGSGGGTALAVAVDNRGFAYVTEFTSSIDFPVTIDVPKAASPKY
jgi:Beta-propeller repeat